MINTKIIKEYSRDLFCALRISLPISIFFSICDYYAGNKFLYGFLSEDSASIMITMLSIYFAVVAVFFIIIIKYQEDVEELFNKDVGEVFNIIFGEFQESFVLLIFIFSLHFFLLIFVMEYPKNPNWLIILGMLVVKIFALSTFFMYFYALYDLISALFRLPSEMREVLTDLSKAKDSSLPDTQNGDGEA